MSLLIIVGLFEPNWDDLGVTRGHGNQDEAKNSEDHVTRDI